MIQFKWATSPFSFQLKRLLFLGHTSERGTWLRPLQKSHYLQAQSSPSSSSSSSVGSLNWPIFEADDRGTESQIDIELKQIDSMYIWGVSLLISKQIYFSTRKISVPGEAQLDSTRGQKTTGWFSMVQCERGNRVHGSFVKDIPY